MKYNVVINTDDNYLQHAMAMLCSLFDTNSNHQFIIHVLTHHLSEENIQSIKGLSERYRNTAIIYNVDEKPLDGVQFRKKRPLTKAAYYRLLLSSIISQDINKILYLDCDMIILDDISPLFSLDLSNYALAATADHMPVNDQHRQQLNMEFDERTFCSGIMVVNLEYWRKNNAEELLLKYAKQPRDVVYLHDQDVLNYVFKKQWFRLPPKWNRIVFNLVPGGNRLGYKRNDLVEYLDHPAVVHYANIVKPWYNIWMPMRNYYRYFLKKSGCKHVVFEKIGFMKRVQLEFIIFRYIYRYYILPFMPKIIYILCSDLFNLLELLYQPQKVRNKYYCHKMGL